MTLEIHGRNILGSEVTAVGRDGFWLITHDREYFIPFNSYPIFRKATVHKGPGSKGRGQVLRYQV
jgi:hypothetical protein